MSSSNIAGTVSKIDNVFELDDTNVEVYFELDGASYQLAHFSIHFNQEIDYKGQPQHETKGGQFSIVLTQSIPSSIYDWAKRVGKRKDGSINFTTKTRGTILNIVFENADCINLSLNVDAHAGTTTTLVIAPERITFNGATHDNRWRS